MPGDTVRINNSDEFEWYVGDSKMPNLILYLDKIGYKTNDEIEHEGTTEGS